MDAISYSKAAKNTSQLADIAQQLAGGLGATIDDVTAAANKVYSSIKVQDLVNGISSSGVADGSMGLNKLQSCLIINESINKFNLATATVDKSLKADNGTVTSSAGNSVSDYIAVKGGCPYKKISNSIICWYNSSKTFISGATTGTAISAPDAAAYARFATPTSSISADMFVFGWESTSTYIPYVVNRILNTALDSTHLTMQLVKTANLVDFDTLEFNCSYNTTTGVRTVGGGFAWTAKIPVKPGYKYTYRKGDDVGTQFIFWTEADTYISSTSANIAKAPATASYMRVRINALADLMIAVVLESTNRLDYYLPPTQTVVKPTNVTGYFKSKWQGKTWWVMGDSQSTGDGIGGSFSTKPYHYLLMDERKIKVQSSAVSGRTLSGNSSDDVCMQVTNGVMPETAYAPDLITICAGANDFGYNYVMGANTDNGTTSFKGGLNKLFTDIQTRFPKASIGMITPLMRSTDANNGVGLKQIDYINAIKEIALMYSIPVLDLYNQGGLNFRNSAVNTSMSVSGDGLHANNDGHKILAARIGSFIESL